jgi:hypothetical protein
VTHSNHWNLPVTFSCEIGDSDFMQFLNISTGTREGGKLVISDDRNKYNITFHKNYYKLIYGKKLVFFLGIRDLEM